LLLAHVLAVNTFCVINLFKKISAKMSLKDLILANS